MSDVEGDNSDHSHQGSAHEEGDAPIEEDGGHLLLTGMPPRVRRCVDQALATYVIIVGREGDIVLNLSHSLGIGLIETTALCLTISMTMIQLQA